MIRGVEMRGGSAENRRETGDGNAHRADGDWLSRARNIKTNLIVDVGILA